ARLYFVKDQNNLVVSAPVGKLAHVFPRSEIRPDTLIGFHYHASHVIRVQSRSPKGIEERVEPCILLPIPIRERRINNRRIQIDYPGFLPTQTSSLLCSQRAAMEPALEPNDANLLLATNGNPSGPSEFNRALGCFRTGRQQEYFLQIFGRQARKAGHQLGSFFTWE